MATSSTQDCYVALELSRSKWLVGALLPGRSKITSTLVPGGDTAIHIEPEDRVVLDTIDKNLELLGPLTPRSLVGERPFLVFFYLFDWSST